MSPTISGFNYETLNRVQSTIELPAEVSQPEQRPPRSNLFGAFENHILLHLFLIDESWDECARVLNKNTQKSFSAEECEQQLNFLKFDIKNIPDPILKRKLLAYERSKQKEPVMQGKRKLEEDKNDLNQTSKTPQVFLKRKKPRQHHVFMWTEEADHTLLDLRLAGHSYPECVVRMEKKYDREFTPGQCMSHMACLVRQKDLHDISMRNKIEACINRKPDIFDSNDALASRLNELYSSGVSAKKCAPILSTEFSVTLNENVCQKRLKLLRSEGRLIF